MELSLQKANAWKRISAFLLDAILTVILAVGFGFLLSSLLKYDEQTARMEALYAAYEKEYDTSFDLTEEKYNALSDEEKAKFDAAYSALTADQEVLTLYQRVFGYTFLIVTFGLLAAFLILEFGVPMWLGEGRTLGKKVFGLAVMRIDHVRAGGVILFVRAILGKFTLETMIPVYVLIMLMFNTIGILGGIALVALAVTQLIILVTSGTGALLHDKLASTVVVDMATQRIYATPEEMLEAKKTAAAERAKRAEW